MTRVPTFDLWGQSGVSFAPQNCTPCKHTHHFIFGYGPSISFQTPPPRGEQSSFEPGHEEYLTSPLIHTPQRKSCLRSLPSSRFFSIYSPPKKNQLVLETTETPREATKRLLGTLSVSKTPIDLSLEMSLASHKFIYVKDVAEERLVPPPQIVKKLF